MAEILVRENSLVSKYNEAEKEKNQLVRVPIILIAIAIITFFASLALIILVDSVFYLLSIVSAVFLAIGLAKFFNVREKYGHLYEATSDSIIAGIEGELNTVDTMKHLPEFYKVIPDITINSSSGKSQIDFIVISDNNIFIVEVKNYNGDIIIDPDSRFIIQQKIGRGGTPYSSEKDNPIRQVSKHVFRLKEFLSEKGVRDIPWIQGIVYFSNEEASIIVRNPSERIPVIHGEEEILDYIKNYSNGRKFSDLAKKQVLDLLWK